jgi:hypothetical protein
MCDIQYVQMRAEISVFPAAYAAGYHIYTFQRAHERERTCKHCHFDLKISGIFPFILVSWTLEDFKL